MAKNLKIRALSIFCNEHGVDHNFSTLRTPQQNAMVERKNQTLEDTTRTMLIASGLARFLGQKL